MNEASAPRAGLRSQAPLLTLATAECCTAPGPLVLTTQTRHRLRGAVVLLSVLRDLLRTLRGSLSRRETSRRGFLGEIHVPRAGASAGAGGGKGACARPAVNKHCAGAVGQGLDFYFFFLSFVLHSKKVGTAKANPGSYRRSTIWLLLLSLCFLGSSCATTAAITLPQNCRP